MRVLRGVLATAFALAWASPAYAVPPVFNGDVISKTTPFFNVKAYGAKCDGSTDDSTAINSAITAAGSSGGVVILPAATCAVASTITISKDNVWIVGQGADSRHDIGSVTPASALLWTGSSGGTILQCTAIAGGSNQAQTRCGVQNIALLSNNGLAGIGLSIVSSQQGTFSNLYFDNFSSHGLYMGVVATLGEASDSQLNLLTNLAFRNVSASSTGDLIYLDGNNAGSPAGNTSMNTFINVQGQYYNANAIDFNNADNNIFMGTQLTRVVGGTGIAVDFLGSNAYANQFFRLTPGLGGVTAATGSQHNSIYEYDSDNGAPTPVVASGAQLYYTNHLGYQFNGGYIEPAVGENSGNAGNARSRMGTTESVRIYNTSGDHMRLDDGTNVWGLNIDGSGNFRFSRFAGSGSLSIGVPIVSTNTVKTSSSITAGSSTAVTCASGDGCFSESASTGEINLGGSTQSCYLNYGITAATALNVGCAILTGNGVQPNGNGNGYTPTLQPLGVAQPHPRSVTGECSVTTPSTACTLAGAFAFADTTYTCVVTAEGTTSATVSYAKTSTTQITIYSGTSATFSYFCTR